MEGATGRPRPREKAELKLDDAALARGSVVYRRWCMQCHGPSGAGEAAHAVAARTAARATTGRGVFKYITAFPPPALRRRGWAPPASRGAKTSSAPSATASTGRSCPRSRTLTEQEVEDVVSYVIHLSVRGEMEFAAWRR